MMGLTRAMSATTRACAGLLGRRLTLANSWVVERGYASLVLSTTPDFKHEGRGERIVRQLGAVVGPEYVSTSAAVREAHGRDESGRAEVDGIFAPDVVVFPKSTEEVASTIEVCTEWKIPVHATGTLTSLEGHTAFLRGGICVDMTRMNEVLRVDEEDLTCRVQAGVTRKQLNEYLRDTGLFFPIDPGADASIGGMASCRASGTNAVRYGTMRDVVKGVTAVTSGGKVLRCGGSGRAKKSATGYDLTALFVGAEGTLGVITEIQLQLSGWPNSISSAVSQFDRIEDAVSAVVEIVQYGIPVARVELLDEVQVRAVNAYSNLEMNEKPSLFFEFHGTSEEATDSHAKTVGEIVRDNNGGNFQWATIPEERSALWTARHNAYYAALALRPKSRALLTDVCVPISKMAESIAHTKTLLRESNLLAPLVGHVGDGNYHMVILLDPNDDDETSRARTACEEISRHSIELGGTCSGEHGIGYGKLKYLEQEHGPEALEAMHLIKSALDPHNLFNPGKLGSPAEAIRTNDKE